MVQGGMSCIKYILAFFNFIFVICGIVMVVVGGVVQHGVSKYNLSGHNVTAAPALLIAVGVFIFLLSFLGCCGALKENHTMVMMFSVLLTLITILEVGAMIAGFVLRHKIEDGLKQAMYESIPEYSEDKYTKSMWDATQHDFKCCGVNNSTDWTSRNSSDIVLPETCCSDDDIVKNSCPPTKAYPKGCFGALLKYLGDKAYIIGSVALAIAIIEVLGILCGCYLARSIRRQYEMV